MSSITHRGMAGAVRIAESPRIEEPEHMYHSNPWDRPEAIEARDAAGRAPKHNPERVDVGDRYEVRRWCQRFLCTEATLRQAVGEVGDDPGRVQAAVKRLG